MEDLYVKNEDDNPYDVPIRRLWSVKNMFRFLLVGVPRLFAILFLYIIVIIILLLVGNIEYLFKKIWRWASRLKLYLYGFKKLDIDNETEKIIKESKAQIIIANHASYVDPFIMMHLFPDAKFVASEFMKNIPVLPYIYNRRCIYLKNDFGGNLTKEIENEIKKGTRIVFFAEGVCSNPDLFLKLRNGAFVPQKDILSVHISYPNNNHWVAGEQDMVEDICIQCSNKKNYAKIRALPDYHISEEEKKDIELLKENYRIYYAKGFGIKLSNKSYKDHPYYKLKLPTEKN